MENRWTLHVQNLGKIELADITVAPLTLFVGDNNSGKSYLMTLIYTLLNTRWYAQGYDLCVRTKEYKRVEKWFRSGMERSADDAVTMELTPEISQSFRDLLNLILGRNAAQLVKRAFNEEIEIGSLSVTLPENLVLRSLTVSQRVLTETEMPRYRISFMLGGDRGHWKGVLTNRLDDLQPVISYILQILLMVDFNGIPIGDICFLPTSRTGFLLTYRSLIGASLKESFDEDERKPFGGRLTRPCSDFLQRLSKISYEHSSQRFNEILQLIEDKMMQGHVEASSTLPQASFYYHPEMTDLSLPMYLSSGVVTELAPLALMLKYDSFETLFIEEPEIGLHPKLQLTMARVLLRLCNAEVPVFATTHSDTILQHVNNMLKLNNLKGKERDALMEQYGYDERDLVQPADVAMYQFDVNEKTGRSTIRILPRGKYGFEIPTFNDALESLLAQTVAFEGDRDEE